MLQMTHLGGPTVLIELAGWRILTDPTFDAPGQTYEFGWGTRSTKTSGPARAPEAVAPVDVVLLSHDHHADNLDDAGRALLPSAGAVVTTRAGARRLGGAARGLAAWETTELSAPGRPTIRVTATPARHGPPLSRPVAASRPPPLPHPALLAATLLRPGPHVDRDGGGTGPYIGPTGPVPPVPARRRSRMRQRMPPRPKRTCA